MHAEWIKTRDLVQQNYQFHFCSLAFFPIHYYRETIQLQCLPPIRYMMWHMQFEDLYRIRVTALVYVLYSWLHFIVSQNMCGAGLFSA